MLQYKANALAHPQLFSRPILARGAAQLAETCRRSHSEPGSPKETAEMNFESLGSGLYQKEGKLFYFSSGEQPQEFVRAPISGRKEKTGIYHISLRPASAPPAENYGPQPPALRMWIQSPRSPEPMLWDEDPYGSSAVFYLSQLQHFDPETTPPEIPDFYSLEQNLLELGFEKLETSRGEFYSLEMKLWDGSLQMVFVEIENNQLENFWVSPRH